MIVRLPGRFFADQRTVPATLSWVAWARTLRDLESFGIEGTGSYGASLARFVRRQGLRIVEVNLCDRRKRRNDGKNDTLDAEAAARSVLVGVATATFAEHCRVLRQREWPNTRKSLMSRVLQSGFKPSFPRPFPHVTRESKGPSKQATDLPASQLAHCSAAIRRQRRTQHADDGHVPPPTGRSYR